MAKYENSMHDCQWFNLKLILTNNREREGIWQSMNLSPSITILVFLIRLYNKLIQVSCITGDDDGNNCHYLHRG